MDKYGIRAIFFVMCVLVALGQIVVTIGGAGESYIVILLGRFIYGLGGEGLFIGVLGLMVKWFKGRDLIYAQSFNTFLSFLGGAYDSYFTPKVFDHFERKLWPPFFLTAIFVCIGGFTALLACLMDRQADKQRTEEEIRVDLIKISWADFKQVKQNTLFWLLMLNIFITTQNFYGVTNYLNDLLEDRFGFDYESAGQMLSLMYLTMSLLSPLVGYVIGKNGQLALSMIVSTVLFLCAHTVLALLPDYSSQNYISELPLTILAVAMSIWQTLVWSAVPKVVAAS